MASKKLINYDLGECLTPNPNTHIMPLIDMANIACSGHACDDKSMVQTIQLAAQNNTAIEAHSNYFDKENFGHKINPNLPKNIASFAEQLIAKFPNLIIDLTPFLYFPIGQL